MFFVCVAESYEIKGVAKTLDGKTILYTERHEITLNSDGISQKIETSYLRPDGTLFAKNVADFSKNKTVPETQFEDLRFKKKEELTFLPDGKQILLKIVKDGKPEEEKFTLTEKMVVGQGFDNFIKINFDKLIKNQISISFGVLAKLDFFDFTAQARNVSSKYVTFGINVSNLFLSFFVSELQVTYDRETKQLITYKGLSNLPDDRGNDQSVLIEYEKTKP